MEIETLPKSIYDRYTLAHERASTKRDRFNRYIAAFDTLASLEEPVVTQAMHPHVTWPNGKKFAVALTHDIDEIYLSPKKTLWYGYQALKKGKIRKGLRAAYALINKKVSPIATFGRMIEIEAKYQATSSYYFIATNGKDGRYDITEAKKYFNMIDAAEGEVGLHGSRDSYAHAATLQEEKILLEGAYGAPVVGIRQHYLCFDALVTWPAHEAVGLRYDCTLGYPDKPGFRNGTAHAFHPIVAGDTLKLWEIPLIIMDATLQGYMKKSFVHDRDELFLLCTTYIDTVASMHGAVSILWHNDRFDDVLHPGAEAFYNDLLAYIDRKGGWMTTGKNIIDHLESIEV